LGSLESPEDIPEIASIVKLPQKIKFLLGSSRAVYASQSKAKLAGCTKEADSSKPSRQGSPTLCADAVGSPSPSRIALPQGIFCHSCMHQKALFFSNAAIPTDVWWQLFQAQ